MDKNHSSDSARPNAKAADIHSISTPTPPISDKEDSNPAPSEQPIDETFETCEFCRDGKCTEGLSDLRHFLCHAFQDFHGVLHHAFCYLKEIPFQPNEGVFCRLPLELKVNLLQTLFYGRSQDKGYLGPFDCRLQQFISVEQALLPVLERLSIAPESLSFDELDMAIKFMCLASGDFAESMAREHVNCPLFRLWKDA